MTRHIGTLPEQLDALDADARARFDALFDVSSGTGRLEPPAAMEAWLTERFGSVDAARAQRIIRVTNRWTREGALFNDLRARRPLPASAAPSPSGGDCDFCAPRERTTADTFGRIDGERSTTASNVAKYDEQHGLVVFDSHDPLAWSEEQVVDAFATARRWLAAANDASPGAVYPFVLWNCGARAGGSIEHPHLQVLLSSAGPYARVEAWRDAAVSYQRQTGRGFVEDLVAAHDALELAGGVGVRWLAHLTPVKEREIVLVGASFDDELARAIFRAARLLVDELGARAFNVACYLRPVASVPEDWSALPAVARIVDRGDPARAPSDIGSMELYAMPVVASDPFLVSQAARDARL